MRQNGALNLKLVSKFSAITLVLGGGFMSSSARPCRLIVFADYQKAEESSELRHYKRNITDESKENNVTSNILNSVSIITFGSIVCGTQICQ